MKAVVGLGNPGAEYAHTRHNVGFAVAAELARRHGAGRPAAKFEAEVADIRLDGEKVVLATPMTYMNLSGRSVRKLVDFFNLPIEDLLVVCDDLNLDPGRLRIRRSGSDGGQKGLRDIAARLGTQDFARLRVGIGRPPGRMDAAAWVLAKMTKAQREELDHAVAVAADAVELWCREGVDAAMNRYNAPPAE